MKRGRIRYPSYFVGGDMRDEKSHIMIQFGYMSMFHLRRYAAMYAIKSVDQSD